jgi:hypothetical protein
LQGREKKRKPIYQDPSQIAILLHNFLCEKNVYIKSSTFNALNHACSKDRKRAHSNLGNTPNTCNRRHAPRIEKELIAIWATHPTHAIDDNNCFFFLTT